MERPPLSGDDDAAPASASADPAASLESVAEVRAREREAEDDEKLREVQAFIAPDDDEQVGACVAHVNRGRQRCVWGSYMTPDTLSQVRVRSLSVVPTQGPIRSRRCARSVAAAATTLPPASGRSVRLVRRVSCVYVCV